MRQTSIQGARHSAESQSEALDKYFSTRYLTWLSQTTVGDGEKLLTYLNSALKVLLGTDIFLRVPKKKVKFFCPVKYVNIHIFSHLT
jgi:hypothetical protein